MKPKTVFWLLFIVFLILRIVFIVMFPPFTDESSFVRWGQLMVHNPEFRFASLTYVGRQPLAFWLFGIGAILMHQPILGARLMVLLVNIPVFFITYIWVKRLYTEKISLIALFLLTMCPLFILIQSLALMDGLLFAIAGIIIWLIFDNPGRVPLYRVVLIGILIGTGLWIKTTSLFLLGLGMLTLIIRSKGHMSRQTFIYISLLILIPLLMMLPLLARPDSAIFLKEPSYFVVGKNGLSGLPLNVWARNIYFTGISLLFYLGIPASLMALFVPKTFWNTTSVTLLLWFILPAFSMILLADNFRFRYFGYTSVVLLPLVSAGILSVTEKFKMKWISLLAGVLVTLYGIVFVWKPVYIFSLFPKTSGERDYAFSWPSGYGIPELIRYIDTQLLRGRYLFIAVPDSPGNPSDNLLAVYYFHPYVRILFATLTSATEFRKLQVLTSQVPVYLATRDSLITESVRPFLTPVITFPKPANEDYIGLFRISFSP
jgi:4-amino-4-deoxy-L-arabinose transferase-like glycosyltransferase